MIDGLDRNALVTWWWLRRIGFRIVSTNCDSVPHMLWLTGSRQETGLEISRSYGPDGTWMVWLRSDLAGNRSRFCYIRDVQTVGQLVGLMEAMTDRPVGLVDFNHEQFDQSMAAEAEDCERRFKEYARNDRWSVKG